MKKIMFDPGHGGKDPGAVNSNGTKEAQKVLEIAIKTADILLNKYEGVEVLFTREKDEFIALTERAKMANQPNDIDFFLSFHLNASTSKEATGFESYIYMTSGTTTKEFQTILHSTIYNTLKTYNIQDRGTKRADFSVLRNTKMPACLLEILFISNDRECGLVNNIGFVNETCSAIAEGIAKMFKLSPKTTSIPSSGTLYRVKAGETQIGAFSNQSNILSAVSEQLKKGTTNISIEKVK
jgi:N-acetylmuramoyl-L-alanine amidase